MWSITSRQPYELLWGANMAHDNMNQSDSTGSLSLSIQTLVSNTETRVTLNDDVSLH